MEKKVMKYKYFFISFSVTLLILSVMVMSVALMMTKQPIIEPKTEAQVYIADKSDDINVLFIGKDEEKTMYIYSQYMASISTINIIYIPSEAEIGESENKKTLDKAYEYGGVKSVCDVISSECGLDIQRYVLMDVAKFIEIAGMIGTIEYTLKDDISYKNSGININISAGRQLLDGNQIVDIFRVPITDENRNSQYNIIADITGEIVRQRIDIALTTIVDKLFKEIVNIVDTDITYSDYEKRKQSASVCDWHVTASVWSDSSSAG